MITLSKLPLDSTSVGYQSPLPASDVRTVELVGAYVAPGPVDLGAQGPGSYDKRQLIKRSKLDYSFFFVLLLGRLWTFSE